MCCARNTSGIWQCREGLNDYSQNVKYGHIIYTRLGNP